MKCSCQPRPFPRHPIELNPSIDTPSLRDNFLRFFVINGALSLQPVTATLAVANPLWSADQGVAAWFHERLTPTFVSVLHAFTEFGSGSVYQKKRTKFTANPHLSQPTDLAGHVGRDNAAIRADTFQAPSK